MSYQLISTVQTSPKEEACQSQKSKKFEGPEAKARQKMSGKSSARSAVRRSGELVSVSWELLGRTW